MADSYPEMRGLLVSVVRDVGYRGQPYQFTERYGRAVLIHPDLPKLFLATGDAPALYLQRGPVGNWLARPRFYEDGLMMPCPYDDEGSRIHSMFGGHWVTTSDSRLGEVIGRPAIVPVHDRVEREELPDAWADWQRRHA